MKLPFSCSPGSFSSHWSSFLRSTISWGVGAGGHTPKLWFSNFHNSFWIISCNSVREEVSILLLTKKYSLYRSVRLNAWLFSFIDWYLGWNRFGTLTTSRDDQWGLGCFCQVFIIWYHYVLKFSPTEVGGRKGAFLSWFPMSFWSKPYRIYWY